MEAAINSGQGPRNDKRVAVDVEGYCDPRFASVAEEFERNFIERGDLGASVVVTLQGETVVDLWGGWATADRATPWKKDTLCVMMSCSKGLIALCAHLLASAGELDFEEPVSTYWPEFAAAGKKDILVRHLLNHQAGLPGLREPVKPGGFYDWEYMVDRLAAQEPLWEPGCASGYHALTFGFLVGEVVRRVSGQPMNEFFATEVAGPLKLDLRLGLPEPEHHRVAQLIPAPDPQPGELLPPYIEMAAKDPTSIAGLAIDNNGGYLAPDEWNSSRALAAVVPSTGFVGNARSLAGVYRAIVWDHRIGRFSFDAEDLNQMEEVQSAVLVDQVLLGANRWSLGFVKGVRSPVRVHPPFRMSLSAAAFGHNGMGGSIGFGDVPAGLSFAYIMNQAAPDVAIGPTAQSLIDAAYRVLGYQRSRYDTWVRPLHVSSESGS